MTRKMWQTSHEISHGPEALRYFCMSRPDFSQHGRIAGEKGQAAQGNSPGNQQDNRILKGIVGGTIQL